MNSTVIHAGAVLLEDGLRYNWGIRIEGDHITQVGPCADIVPGEGDVYLNVPEQLLMPGFINGHNHMYNVFSRGISTDAVVTEFSSFLDDFWWPYIENRITPELAALTASWSCAEQLDSGVTTQFDILEAPNAIPGGLEAEAEAIRKAGLRSVLTFEACERMGKESGQTGLQENCNFIKNHAQDDLITGAMSLHTLFTCPEDYVKQGRAMARELGAKFHVHLSESVFEGNWCAEHMNGRKPVCIYDEFGCLDKDFIASQVVQVSQEEIDVLGKSGATAVSMPLSNCEVGGGIAPVTELLEAGVQVGLGTDGYINNFFEVMRGAFLIHKANRQDPQAMGARQVYRMATDMGARALGMENLGRIAPGMLADVITVNMFDTPTPINEKNVYDLVILARNPADVKNVFVGGRQVKRDGKLTTLDRDALREQVRQACARFWEFK